MYQLPTGGGKTVIFTEIAKRYIAKTNKKVVILTHRIELCNQTSNMLTEFHIHNKVINSKVKELPDQDQYMCFVAMVETLNNRLQDGKLDLEEIGMVIVDEAHYNSFRKLFKYFEKCFILGVTATPLSSNINLPMHQIYQDLIVGESISSLINLGFLAVATTYTYNVGLTSLKIGINGDYTVKSSEELYSSINMQEKLLYAYEKNCKGKKTLIFNNGIETSKHVYASFANGGYDVRHLDNTNSKEERRKILDWFKNTPNAILSSVSILTTGFDEPTVECIMLNRATRSLALYFQMIGRGSRILKDKKGFTVIDLGNNVARFGLWSEEVDWKKIFINPHLFLESLINDDELERNFRYVLPEEIRAKFSKSDIVSFDIKADYKIVHAMGLKSKTVLDNSIAQHAKMIIENSEDIFDAKILAKMLKDDIDYRIKQYSYCILKSTKNYLQYLTDDYKKKLDATLRKELM